MVGAIPLKAHPSLPLEIQNIENPNISKIFAIFWAQIFITHFHHKVVSLVWLILLRFEGPPRGQKRTLWPFVTNFTCMAVI